MKRNDTAEEELLFGGVCYVKSFLVNLFFGLRFLFAFGSGTIYFFDLLFKLAPLAENLAPAAEAAQTEIRTDPKHLPTAFTAGVLFFHGQNVTKLNIHGLSPAFHGENENGGDDDAREDHSGISEPG